MEKHGPESTLRNGSDDFILAQLRASHISHIQLPTNNFGRRENEHLNRNCGHWMSFTNSTAELFNTLDYCPRESSLDPLSPTRRSAPCSLVPKQGSAPRGHLTVMWIWPDCRNVWKLSKVFNNELSQPCQAPSPNAILAIHRLKV